VPEEKRVYLNGWGYDQDPDHVADHPELWRSPAMAAASSAAHNQAGIDIDQVAHLDLYSCFASSVCFALDALGLQEGDPRSVTQTGGLPYHGGPGSNYMTHSIAAMAETLRADPGSHGLTSGVGMHMMKHAYGVWSTTPAALNAPVAITKADAPSRIVTSPEGAATVATYSVLHGRDGEPTSCLLVCDLPDGGRCYATLAGGTDGAAWKEAESTELIGRTVHLTPNEGINQAQLA
jgi:acetyl-CoA C-acetyltransferase